MTYVAAADRYQQIAYRRCGRSGIQLPEVSLGLWHNFGDDRPLENSRAILRRAFDLGITHFDLANNYGVPYGSAEKNFGRILREDFGPYRDELIISTKAGYDMWPGPYGEWGSRKYLLASLDQSLQRMGLDYVDIFYSHRFDPKNPMQETLGAHGRGGRDHAPDGHADPHSPALVLDAEPLDRGRPAGGARPGRHRLHRVLAARPGRAQRQVRQRDSRGLAGQPSHVAGHLPAQRRDAEPRARAGRDRAGARPVDRAARPLLGAAGPAGHVGADRRQQRRAARGERGGGRALVVHR